MKYLIKICFFFLLLSPLLAQNRDSELGANVLNRSFQQSGFFDLSDPEAVNIKVSVWGWVRYPGKYTIPSYTTVSDLISYAGGPQEGADLEDIRILRTNEDSTQRVISFSFDDVLRGDKASLKLQKIERLEAGDVLVLPGQPRLYFRDHMSIWMSVFSVLISLSILILNIVKN